MRILKPGFSVASPEYVVGLLAPRHLWMMPESEESDAGRSTDGVAASS